MFKDFKESAIEGHVIDMPVGILIGAAFTTVVKSVVDEVIMPPLGSLMGSLDFAGTFVVLRPGTTAASYGTLAQAKATGATVLAYGHSYVLRDQNGDFKVLHDHCTAGPFGRELWPQSIAAAGFELLAVSFERSCYRTPGHGEFPGLRPARSESVDVEAARNGKDQEAK